MTPDSLETTCFEVARKYTDMIHCGQPIPAWMDCQVDGIILMETDFFKGWQMLMDGLQAESEYLKGLL